MGPLSLCPFGTTKSKRSSGHHNNQQQQQQQHSQIQQQHQSNRHIATNNVINNNNSNLNSNNSISKSNVNSNSNNNNLNSLNGEIDIKQNINIRSNTRTKIHQHHQNQLHQSSTPPTMNSNQNGYINTSIRNQAFALPVASANATSNRHRYVISDFEPKVRDEIRVIQGDVVYFEYTDVEELGQSWAHVVCIRNNERGFIPSSLLTTDPIQPVQFKKKLPRCMPTTGIISNINHNSHSHHLNHNHLVANQQIHSNQHAQQQIQGHPSDNDNVINNIHSSSNHDQLLPINSHQHNQHNQHINNNNNPIQIQKTILNNHTGQLSCNSENIQPHRHTFNHQPRFGISHSLQGSSGKQSLQKSCDSTHMGPPSYNHCLPQVLDLETFYHDHNDIYVVLFNFVAREENDLSVRPGDYLIVLNKDDRDWYWVRRDDDKVEGFVPAKFICEYEQAKSMLKKGNSISSVRSSSNQQSNDLHTYINHKPEKESTLTNTDQHSSLFHS